MQGHERRNKNEREKRNQKWNSEMILIFCKWFSDLISGLEILYLQIKTWKYALGVRFEFNSTGDDSAYAVFSPNVLLCYVENSVYFFQCPCYNWRS